MNDIDALSRIEQDELRAKMLRATERQLTWGPRIVAAGWGALGFFALAVLVGIGFGIHSYYWHHRWQDEELYRLRQQQQAVVNFLTQQAQKGVFKQ